MSIFGIFASDLPQHCEPTSDFLRQVSATLGTCIPTPLAAISSLLGTLSILSWLCAQLPQIIKNYRLKSTSGLSIWFLAEWCLGDFSNLSGALLTRQAAWQIIIGAYYCFVDFSLVIQWFWYEHLRHGRRMRGILRSTFRRYREDSNGDMRVIEGLSPLGQDERALEETRKMSTPLPTPIPRPVSDGEEGFFRIPKYNSSPAPDSVRKPGVFSNRTIRRLQDQPLPSPSPKTVLFITFLITIACQSGVANANPISRLDEKLDDLDFSDVAVDVIGPLLSWLSTFLYLTSRLPQLIKNARLRSTAGLSPQLFAAAFCGNFFYSASMLFNPQAWHSYEAYGANGWVGSYGSDRREWLTGAAPFFLGAALVLMLDLLVGVQFWMYAQTVEEVVLVVEEDGQAAGRWKWKEVHGWMRGWKPSISRLGTPAGSRDGSATESGSLLGEGSTSDRGYGAA